MDTATENQPTFTRRVIDTRTYQKTLPEVRLQGKPGRMSMLATGMAVTLSTVDGVDEEPIVTLSGRIVKKDGTDASRRGREYLRVTGLQRFNLEYGYTTEAIAVADQLAADAIAEARALDAGPFGRGEQRAPATSAQVQAGVDAGLATLRDRETGAGSDLSEDIEQEDDVYVSIFGNVDFPQLAREIIEAAARA